MFPHFPSIFLVHFLSFSSKSSHTLYFSHVFFEGDVGFDLCEVCSDLCEVGSDRCDSCDRHDTESSDFDSFSELES